MRTSPIILILDSVL